MEDGEEEEEDNERMASGLVEKSGKTTMATG